MQQVNLAQYLLLERPLAVLDLETTGFSVDDDRITQISVTMHYAHRDPIHWASLVNPGIPIKNSSTHGITDARVAEAPTFALIAPALGPRLMTVDIAGYNVDFDIGFMRAEMKRAGVDWPWDGFVVDSKVIYHMKMTRTLSDAYKEYGGEDGQPLPEGATLEGAHDAGVDVAATEIVLRGQLVRYGSALPRTVKELSLFCFPKKENAIDRKGQLVWHQDKVCIAFGKHAKNGPKPLEDVVKGDRRYLEWLVKELKEQDTKEIITAALMGVYPRRENV